MKRIIMPLLLLLSVMVAGTIGYALIEGWSLLDSLYMTVITLSTVGLGEVHPLDVSGRVLTLILVTAGVLTVTLLLGSLARMIVEGEFKQLLWRQKVEKAIAKLKKHVIICGYGRIGREVVHCFSQTRVPYLVIEKEEAVIREMEMEGIPCILGDATVEEVMIRGGIQKAKGLVAALESDADNVYVCLTARSLSPHIHIVARAGDDRGAKNLKQAGADRVISPNLLGGQQMAQAVLRPAVLEFLHLTSNRTSMGLHMEEIRLTGGSPYVGQALRESDLRSAFGLIVVAIQKVGGEMLFNPGPDQTLEEDDTLVVLGKTESLRRLTDTLA